LRKALFIVLAAVAGLIVVFLIAVALQPAEYHVERSASIAAPPAAVFPHVNDFRKWDAWSPWAKLDPNAKAAFEGPEAGAGAVFRWAGNEEVGEGSMTIVESRPDEFLRIKLAFIKPFEDAADVAFTFEPQEDRTLVTWSMSGKNNFIGRAMCLFMDLDAMIGKDYEQGLANLKKVVEAEPAAPATGA
jgi:hypothetical protein